MSEKMYYEYVMNFKKKFGKKYTVTL